VLENQYGRGFPGNQAARLASAVNRIPSITPFPRRSALKRGFQASRASRHSPAFATPCQRFSERPNFPLERTKKKAQGIVLRWAETFKVGEEEEKLFERN